MTPPAMQRALDFASTTAMVGLALFLTYWMTLGMFETLDDGALSRVLGWPEWPFYAPGVVSLFVWALVAGRQLVQSDADG
jgi:TRAP-type C4-dicarboxylate transport system permease small subunit